MVNLRKKPKRATGGFHNTVQVDNKTAADIAESIRGSMDRMIGLVQTVMTEQQRLLHIMGVQQKETSDTLAALLKQQPAAPVVNIASRPQSFQVAIEKDDEGATTGMQITAARG